MVVNTFFLGCYNYDAVLVPFGNRDECQVISKLTQAVHPVAVVIPGGVWYRVSHLYIRSILPLDVTIGIVKKCSAKVFSFSVLLKGGLSMTKGEWLLNLEALNVEWVVDGVASCKKGWRRGSCEQS